MHSVPGEVAVGVGLAERCTVLLKVDVGDAERVAWRMRVWVRVKVRDGLALAVWVRVWLRVGVGDADTVFEAALEAGAEDVESGEEEHSIWTAMDALHEVSKALEASLGAADSAKLAWRPQTLVEVDEANAATLLKMIDALEDDDDVQTVWGNYDVSDDVMAKLG